MNKYLSIRPTDEEAEKLVEKMIEACVLFAQRKITFDRFWHRVRGDRLIYGRLPANGLAVGPVRRMGSSKASLAVRQAHRTGVTSREASNRGRHGYEGLPGSFSGFQRHQLKYEFAKNYNNLR